MEMRTRYAKNWQNLLIQKGMFWRCVILEHAENAMFEAVYGHGGSKYDLEACKGAER